LFQPLLGRHVSFFQTRQPVHIVGIRLLARQRPEVATQGRYQSCYSLHHEIRRRGGPTSFELIHSLAVSSKLLLDVGGHLRKLVDRLVHEVRLRTDLC
jgi:hypothetical protein